MKRSPKVYMHGHGELHVQKVAANSLVSRQLGTLFATENTFITIKLSKYLLSVRLCVQTV